ncbi:hypothetical protein CIB48_g10269 [Xylaria polymorpha]|nr:hypothetical protein CIB48_g10269 [Xylaria polymorpha]
MTQSNRSALSEQIAAEKRNEPINIPKKSKTETEASQPKNYPSPYVVKPGNKTYGIGSCVDRYSGKDKEPDMGGK